MLSCKDTLEAALGRQLIPGWKSELCGLGCLPACWSLGSLVGFHCCSSGFPLVPHSDNPPSRCAHQTGAGVPLLSPPCSSLCWERGQAGSHRGAGSRYFLWDQKSCKLKAKGRVVDNAPPWVEICCCSIACSWTCHFPWWEKQLPPGQHSFWKKSVG